MKKVSVIIPVYQVEKYISDCVDSVLKQTYPLIEMIVVDDHGNDASMDIVMEKLNKIHQDGFSFRIIRHKYNQGQSAARNHGIEIVTGDYILFLDSDDMLEPSCVEEMVECIEKENADVVMCDFYSDKENKNLGGHICTSNRLLNTNQECLHGLSKCWFNVMAWSKLLKTSFVKNNRLYFEEHIINEDVLWTFALCLKANKIALLNKQLYYYRYNENSIMSRAKADEKIKSTEIILKKYNRYIMQYDGRDKNIDVYVVLMRQIILYYAIIARTFGLKLYLKKIRLFKSDFFVKDCFPGFLHSIPPTYKLWNLLAFLPEVFFAIFTYLLIMFQSNLKK